MALGGTLTKLRRGPTPSFGTGNIASCNTLICVEKQLTAVAINKYISVNNKSAL